MALSPAISRVAGGATAHAPGYPAVGPIADVMETPATGLDASETFGHGSFDYFDFVPEQTRAHSDQTSADSNRPRRRVVSGLLSTSTESFSIAFAQYPQFSVLPYSPGGPDTRAAMQHGIDTYELIAAVIYGQLAPRGENLSITL
jgi:hypothetical protein